MTNPPDYKESACCLNCEHFNYNHYKNCMKHGQTVDMSMICSDYELETIRMTKSDYSKRSGVAIFLSKGNKSKGIRNGKKTNAS